jgi:proteasome lid subunit RPN8/RPN11
MSVSPNGGALATWAPPECPFTVAWAPEVLDGIRLAVVDAFYSLPHGGAEIGGILTGTTTAEGIVIAGYSPLECEHAYGPSFTLSPKDHSRLAELLVAAQAQGTQIVGWYHSHTRSEICLSEADLDLHNRYFRESWQVALVMKPHTFEPARCGFFFREPDGSVRCEASCLEFPLDTAVSRPAPAHPPAAPDGRAATRPADAVLQDAADSAVAAASDPAGPEVAAANAAPAPGPGTEEHGSRESAAAGLVASLTPAGRSLAWLYWLLLACVVVSVTYLTRDRWLGTPGRTLSTAPASPAPHPGAVPVSGAAKGANSSLTPAGAAAAAPGTLLAPSLGLQVTDTDGQLRIQWDRAAAPVLAAAGGTLQISDGDTIHAVPLTPPQVHAGTFSYLRQAERLEVKLTLDQPGGARVEDLTGFLGRLPQSRAAEEQEVRRQRDALEKENARLKAGLSAQPPSGHKTATPGKEIPRNPPKRRLGNQSGDAVR